MKQKWKGSTLLSPVPAVLVCCGKGEKKNVFTVAWTGIINSHPPKTYVSVRPQRFSYDIINSEGVFTINLPTAKMVKELDFCGVKSGREVDKFSVCGFEAEDSFEVDCVSIAQCPVTLECKVTNKLSLGSHDMFIADIVCVSVDDKYLYDGKLCLDKCEPVAYSHGEYYSLGKKLGSFGYSVMKKSTKKARQRRDGKK